TGVGDTLEHVQWYRKLPTGRTKREPGLWGISERATCAVRGHGRRSHSELRSDQKAVVGLRHKDGPLRGPRDLDDLRETVVAMTYHAVQSKRRRPTRHRANNDEVEIGRTIDGKGKQEYGPVGTRQGPG